MVFEKIIFWEKVIFVNPISRNAGVQGKYNAYHNVDKVENQGIYEWILNLIDIVVYVVFALYSRISVFVKQSVKN